MNRSFQICRGSIASWLQENAAVCRSFAVRQHMADANILRVVRHATTNCAREALVPPGIDLHCFDRASRGRCRGWRGKEAWQCINNVYTAVAHEGSTQVAGDAGCKAGHPSGAEQLHASLSFTVQGLLFEPAHIVSKGQPCNSELVVLQNRL